MPEIQRIPLVSSNLKACGYDKEASILFVQFQNGVTYAYEHVPEATFTELVNAPSPGKFFSACIRGRYAYVANVFAENAPANGDGANDVSSANGATP